MLLTFADPSSMQDTCHNLYKLTIKDKRFGMNWHLQGFPTRATQTQYVQTVSVHSPNSQPSHNVEDGNKMICGFQYCLGGRCGVGKMSFKWKTWLHWSVALN